MESWRDYLTALSAGLTALAVTAGDGTELAPAEAFRQWVDLTHVVHTGGQNVYIVGNGGSAMIAGHMAADACKNGGLRALAFNDAAFLTATSNDLAFEEVFAVPLMRHGRAGDLLITISSSGNSPNILRALDVARSLSMRTVTLSGKGADNRSRTLGDLNFYVPSPRYGWVESAHQVVIHYWLDQYMDRYGQGAQ